jgi:predicted acylesterase/phospholipase RssA
MSEPIRLKDAQPRVDRTKIGISYSGGGPLVLIELGCARAFVDKGIRPAVISGVSAGSLAGAAHALDPVGGQGIELAADLLSRITGAKLGFGWLSVLERLAKERQNLRSLADHKAIGPMIQEGIRDRFGLAPCTIGSFQITGRPKLMLAATNRLDGTSLWFTDEVPIEDALLASSSIPGVFPWQEERINDADWVLVDGGVVENQPLSQLALEGCGTIYACAVGYGGGAVARPTNAVDNAVPCIWMMQHQAMKLEEELVRCKIGDQGSVHHIHPEVDVPIEGYNFSAAEVATVMEEARHKTASWLDQIANGTIQD